MGTTPVRVSEQYDGAEGMELLPCDSDATGTSVHPPLHLTPTPTEELLR